MSHITNMKRVMQSQNCRIVLAYDDDLYYVMDLGANLDGHGGVRLQYETLEVAVEVFEKFEELKG